MTQDQNDNHVTSGKEILRVTIRDLHTLGIEITGGMDAVEYVRRMRAGTLPDDTLDHPKENQDDD